MNSILKTLRALPLAMLMMAVGLAFLTVPMPAVADEGADNQFLDGNWFTIAQAKGEAYGEGSPTQVALEAQLELYQGAVDNGDLEKAEHYAIRSWVKGWYAAEIGRKAYESGDYTEAKSAFQRAKQYGKDASKAGAGKGEKVTDPNDQWGGGSAVQGPKVKAYAKKWLDRVNAKLGAGAGSDE